MYAYVEYSNSSFFKVWTALGKYKHAHEKKESKDWTEKTNRGTALGENPSKRIVRAKWSKFVICFHSEPLQPP